MGIDSNIQEIIGGLSDFEKKQLPYALRVASNNLAFETMNRMKYEISTKLKIKKRSMISIVRIKKATKNRPYAEVFIDEHTWQYKALAHHFYGGDRERKGLEKMLIYSGLMYKWEILTPPPGVTIRPSVYIQIASQLKINYKAGYNANETNRSRMRKTADKKTRAKYFVITGKSASPLPPGIYARMDGVNKPICILRIAEKPSYREIFDFGRTLNETYNDRGNDIFSKALEYALWTSK